MPVSLSNARAVPLPSASAVVTLLKPITWFPPMWAFGCGVVSAGEPILPHWALLLFGVLLTGPLVCGMSQAVNDWFDREVDAVNEPHRPIPSGRVPGRWGLYIGLFWTFLSLLVASRLGPIVMLAALIGIVLAWLYSAPPVRLKQNGWWGNAAVGLCYEGLPWITGAAVLAGGAGLDSRIIIAALLYSAGAHGIMTLNDFKSVRGDTALGLKSLPVQLGVHRAAELACVFMAVAQLCVIGLLLWLGQWIHAGIISLLLVGQLCRMRRLLDDPERWAPWYNATGVSLYVTGMLVCAFALR